MKVTLVNPGEAFRMKTSYLPLGLGYIGAVLRENDVPVEGLDLRFHNDWDQVRSHLERLRPAILGIGAMTLDVKRALEVARICKDLDPECKVVVGGPHPSVRPRETVSDSNIDVVVVGEGEYTMLELVRWAEGRGDLSEIKGIFYKRGGEVFETPPRPPVENLDGLPLPARDLFPIGEILRNPCTNFPMPSPSLHIMGSRGCPFNCSFCSNTFGRKPRYRSLDKIFEEIEHLVERYRIRGLMLEDDTFTARRGLLKGFCEEMERRGLKDKIVWDCHARADGVDLELARTMRKAGCVALRMGVESGSDNVLKILGKGTTRLQNRRAIEACRRAGLVAAINVMIGTPGESREDLEKTLGFIRETDPEIVYVGVTTPVPGTRLFDEASKNGTLLVRSWDDFDYGRVGGKFSNLEVSGEELRSFRKSQLRFSFSYRYLTRKHYLMACVRRWKSLVAIGKPSSILKELSGPLRG